VPKIKLTEHIETLSSSVLHAKQHQANRIKGLRGAKNSRAKKKYKVIQSQAFQFSQQATHHLN
jgi:hypothetical protein